MIVRKLQAVVGLDQVAQEVQKCGARAMYQYVMCLSTML